MFGRYRRRGFTRAFGRRRLFAKPAIRSSIHCTQTAVTAAGVAESNIMFTTAADVNDQFTLPQGCTVTRILMRLWATDATPVNGRHTCGMWRRPGGMTFTSEPLTAWYASTFPPTTGMIEARRFKLQKRPHTVYTVTGASGPARMVCFWKGKMIMREGDDILLCLLDDAATNYFIECEVSYIM